MEGPPSPRNCAGHTVDERSDPRLLSVVVPCYKLVGRIDLFRECIASLVQQSYQPIEIVVVDDGSPDGTRQILESEIAELASRLPHAIRLVALQENVGASEARNAGIRAARGEFIGLLDYDDLWFLDFAEEAIGKLDRQPDLEVILGGTILHRSYKAQTKAHAIPMAPDINAMPFASFCAWHLVNNLPVAMGSAVICRRSLFERFPELWMDRFLSKRSAEDVFWGFKLLALGIRPHYLPRPCVVHRARVDDISRSKRARYLLDQQEILDYTWKNAGHAVYETVASEAPSMLPAVNARIRYLGDLFMLTHVFDNPGKLYALGLLARDRRLIKSWLRLWMLRISGGAVTGLLERRAWRGFSSERAHLEKATHLIDSLQVSHRESSASCNEADREQR